MNQIKDKRKGKENTQQNSLVSSETDSRQGNGLMFNSGACAVEMMEMILNADFFSYFMEKWVLSKHHLQRGQ